MSSYDYDIIVIGSGPGGEGAAMKSVKESKRVAVVEQTPPVGGNCTYRTTIPSKTLRHAIQQLAENRYNRPVDYPALLASTMPVLEQQAALRRTYYERNEVDILYGRASFLDPNTVEVALTHGGVEQYTASGFIVASGSRPYHPPDVDFSHPRVLDSDTVLALKDNPRSICIYGAGVIGCEYASIFRGLRIKVNLINTRDRLLSFLDDEIVDALAYHLREQGVLIRHGETYDSIEPDDRGVRVYLQSGKQIYTDYFLWANGRTGNSDNMGLERIGVEINERGAIRVDADYRTSQPHIYAVGDVVGYPSLASAGYDQGRFAATHLIFGLCEYHLVENIPTGIYTIPEISSVGATERELTTSKTPYEVGHAFFRHLARAQITGHTTGMLKILFHRETLQILGIHCFGAQASEIIHIGQAIMSQQDAGNTLLYFVNTTFNYPTMAEAYRVAALNGLNRVR
ncbi:MAG: Si-specific NAD(P)(+) transhydrogenase [candidate division Zixibacteria bacterium]|nr:Si-specific NAD(P)(+) transhydrogenase [candidate division Zixibacteria bacterium]